VEESFQHLKIFQTGKRGSCRRDIVRDNDIFGLNKNDQTLVRDVNALLHSTAKILARDIYFPKSSYDSKPLWEFSSS